MITWLLILAADVLQVSKVKSIVFLLVSCGCSLNVARWYVSLEGQLFVSVALHIIFTHFARIGLLVDDLDLRFRTLSTDCSAKVITIALHTQSNHFLLV